MPAYSPGSFCWFELATTDHQAAKAFYQSLFDWASEDSSMGPTGIYTTFLTGADYAKWIEVEEKRHQVLMKEAGFLAPSN